MLARLRTPSRSFRAECFTLILGCPEGVRSLECQSCLSAWLWTSPPQASWGSVSPLGRKRWIGEFLNCARL